MKNICGGFVAKGSVRYKCILKDSAFINTFKRFFNSIEHLYQCYMCWWRCYVLVKVAHKVWITNFLYAILKCQGHPICVMKRIRCIYIITYKPAYNFVGLCFVGHYCDVIMTSVASQITSLAVVYSIVYSDADERKHQSSTSLAFVRGIHRTKGQ